MRIEEWGNMERKLYFAIEMLLTEWQIVSFWLLNIKGMYSLVIKTLQNIFAWYIHKLCNIIGWNTFFSTRKLN